MNFSLTSSYKPINDQRKAIDELSRGVQAGLKYQVLLGVTGSGKTFTIANIIDKLKMPALIISHNKTLAAQLYQEFRDFFPKNSVNYFVSYYDYYQPEAYIPQTDTYIEKDAEINDIIDKLRLKTTASLMTRNDTIVVASVSCIYNIGSPKEYGNFVFEIYKSQKISRNQILTKLIDLQYERSDFGFFRGSFRLRGNFIDIYPSYEDFALRIEHEQEMIKNLHFFDPISGAVVNTDSENLSKFVLYPAKHYITDPKRNKEVFDEIREDMEKRYNFFLKQGKLLEANRIKQKVSYDLQMIQEFGYVKGIENYSRYFDGRKPGEAPYTLLDYFNSNYFKNWLVFIDESHITFPQIRGMYSGDLSRKKTLIDYGFRLPAAIDNRPLRFEEFMQRIPGFIATSATPGDWEINLAEKAFLQAIKKAGGKKLGLKRKRAIVEQLLRPTGIPDPEVEIRPTHNQVQDVISEVQKRIKKNQRSLITTLTKRTSEDLANYLKEKGINVHYLHSEIETLERSDILDDLRRGKYEVIVGVNLLREGLDLPEVSLVAILDADKEGFLRSEVSLIQTMGRAARHVEGKVILYADQKTKSISKAFEEVKRRRNYQIKMNKKYRIIPKSIEKPIREKLIEKKENEITRLLNYNSMGKIMDLSDIDSQSLTPMDRKKLVEKLRREMKIAAQDLNFELAAEIRDKIRELKD